MTYSVNNSPLLTLDMGSNIAQANSKSGKKVWQYDSADSLATVQGSGYFTNGEDIGMQVGDIVFVSVAGVLKTPLQYVSTISAAGAATIADATT